MKARIERGPSTDSGTFGRLTLETGRSWPTLELPWRGNQRGLSCMLADTYIARLVDSPHFHRKVYRFENKNGREDCEIHPSNFAGDATKGLKSQLHGCAALGRKVGALDTGEGFAQEAVLESAAALDELIAATGGEDIEVTVVWLPGAEPADNPNPVEHSIARPALTSA